MKRILCIFARTPELGRVKQRLAVERGAEQALAAHEALLKRTIQQTVEDTGYTTELWLTRLNPDLPDWLQHNSASLHEQPAGDLGWRMQQVMAASLTRAERCVLIGSDCPGIDSEYVAAAFAALDGSEVVFGPAEDGGYGLVGFSRLVPEVFAESIWGDEGVLDRAQQRLATAAVSVSLLPELYDVDEPADWRRFLAEQND